MAPKKISAKKMPYNLEAEQSILGCMLINNNVVSAIASKVKSQDFYVESHRTIYDAIYSLYSTNRPIDFVTVTDLLEKNSVLESVGGIDYVSNLTEILPSATNFLAYLKIVKRDALLRNLISAGQEIIENCYTSEDSEASLSLAEKLIYDLAEKQEESSLEHIGPALNEAINKMDEIAKNHGQIKGIATGITEFDELTGGLQNSDLVILAERPGCGKTSFALNVAVNAAVLQNKKCAIFSLEMPKVQLAQRALCSVGKVSMA